MPAIIGVRKAKAVLPEVNRLDNESRVRVLRVIDKLRELEINKNISLPQVRAPLNQEDSS